MGHEVKKLEERERNKKESHNCRWPHNTKGVRGFRADLRVLVVLHSLISISIYLIMIEGLGKGVKYSLFVANAIIFVSNVAGHT